MFFKCALICLCLTQLVMTKKADKNYSNFYRGRIPPGSFEYVKLNGFYKPKDAVKVCEQDLACAGFTFKGTPFLKKLEFEVYFFHYFPHRFFEKRPLNVSQYNHWTSYKVTQRNFVKLTNYRIDTESKIYENFQEIR